MRMMFRRSTAVTEPTALDVYDMAFLAGGAQRVVDGAIIALSGRGLLVLRASRVRAGGAAGPREEGDGLAGPALHPVERALVALCPSSRSITWVRDVLRRSPEVQDIARGLAAAGLLAGPRGRPTSAGRRRLRAAGTDGSLPPYVFGGAAALPDGPVRRSVMDAAPAPSGLGRTLIRLGNALDRDSDASTGSDGGSGGGSGCGGGGGGSD